MAKYRITSPEGEAYEVTAPDDATQDQVMAYAQQNFSRPTSRASQIPGVPPQPQRAPESSFMDKLKGAGETALTMATGATGGTVGLIGGALGGLAGAIASGDIGTKNATGRLNDVALENARRFTYEPRTEVGREYAGNVSEALAPLAALSGPVQTQMAASLAAPVARQVAPMARQAVAEARELGANSPIASRLSQYVNPESSPIPGYGAAMTPQATLRNERALSLPVPINLTKGQLERTFQQQKFERETAKMGDIGEPLRQRFADQNEKILQNFDAFVESTGAQAPDLRATGQVINQALVEKASKARSAINEAYDKARASGETQAPVDITPLYEHLEKRKPQSINAGVIGSTKGEIDALAGPQRKDVFGQPIPRTITLNDLEEIRKSVTAGSMKDATNNHFGREIKTIIDQITEGAGGEAYKRARYLRSRFSQEFENVGVVDRLLSKKPGTTDRAVAFEDVFNHSVLNGSLDDVRTMRRTLQTAGATGEQAWRELQGQTVNYLKDAASKNAQRDIRGNPVVSFSGLDKAVRSLDQDGKLDFIFGQRGAQQIRDIREFAADAVTAPPGSVNTSNTSSALLEAFGNAVVGRLPTAAAKVVGVTKNYFDNRKVRQQVNEALNPLPPEARSGPEELQR